MMAKVIRSRVFIVTFYDFKDGYLRSIRNHKLLSSMVMAMFFALTEREAAAVPSPFRKKDF